MNSARKAAELFQRHRAELGFVNRAQCREGDLVTIRREGDIAGALLGNHCVRKDQSTVYELAVDRRYRREGVATELIRTFASGSPHNRLVAKCPETLPANHFYRSTGWELTAHETGKNRGLCVWEMSI